MINLIISASLIAFINLGYIHLLLTQKRSIKYTSFVFSINYLGVILVGYFLLKYFQKDIVYYKYLLYILLSSLIIYISLVYEESLSKKIFTFFNMWLFSNVILIICANVINLFSLENFNLYIFPFALSRIFIELIFFPIIYLYLRDPYKKMLKLVSDKVINIMSFYSIIIFLFLITHYKFNSLKPVNFYEFLNDLLFIIIIILSYVIIFIAMWSVNRNVELEYKFKAIDTQIELQKKNYKNLNESIEKYNAFEHDIRHHNLVIKSMINSKNYIAASEYLDKFTESGVQSNISILCKNFTVDSILKYYMSIAFNNNIDFKVNLNIPEDINIDNLDLTVAIGNCVENAIEACNKMSNDCKKYINIKAEIRELQLVIKIENSFNGQVLKEGNVIKTSKAVEGHGIGLSNVRKITEKYNGYFNVKYNENKFEVHIIINNN